MLPMLLRLALHNHQTAILQGPTFPHDQPFCVDLFAFDVFVMLKDEISFSTQGDGSDDFVFCVVAMLSGRSDRKNKEDGMTDLTDMD